MEGPAPKLTTIQLCGTLSTEMSEFQRDEEDIEDDNVSLSDDEDNGESEVQLGFLEKTKNALFHDPDYNNWDGGKVGGYPVWLDPLSIPSSQQLQCSGCQEPLTFLAQIYCPLDEVEGAFHRCLYWFCCKKRDCFEQSLKCFRNQLPEANSFYAKDESELGKAVFPNLCELCGCRATSCCSKCKGVHYCSKVHQKEHWKHHKTVCKAAEGPVDSSSRRWKRFPQSPEDSAQTNAVFPEYDMVIEEEAVDDEEELLKNAEVMEKTTIWEDAQTPGGEDEAGDAALTQSDYNRAMGSEKHDPTYLAFLTRIQRGGNDQVLRYNRWSVAKASGGDGAAPAYNGPLLVCTNPDTTERIKAVPPCEHCGAPRAFECQIMPQLLHFLQVDKATKIVGEFGEASVPSQDGEGEDRVPTIQSGSFQNQSKRDIDFGSIDVYTCTKSCTPAEGQPTYLTEHIIVQAPPAVYRKKRPAAAGTAVAVAPPSSLPPVAEEGETAESR